VKANDELDARSYVKFIRTGGLDKHKGSSQLFARQDRFEENVLELLRSGDTSEAIARLDQLVEPAAGAEAPVKAIRHGAGNGTGRQPDTWQDRVMSLSASAPNAEPEEEDTADLTLEEFTERVSLTVRNVRFYTARGLIPAPIRRGRSGYYTADHVARFELVRELQAHGFTLAAIQGYLARIPADATPETIALHSTLLAPWMADVPQTLTRAELATRAGRELDEDDLSTLTALGIARPAERDRYEVAVAHLPVGVAMLELGLPPTAAIAAQDIFTAHGRAVAEELTQLFLTQVWPAYKRTGEPPEKLRELVERFKPVTVAALVSAYERAVDDSKRQAAARRTR